MATDKQPRNSAAKKTTPGITRVPTTSTPVSTADPTAGTARNAVVEGNGAADLDDIRKRAYELYEEDGRPDGKHEEHWLRAESELRQRSAGKNKPSRSSQSNQQRIA
jgi:hypothetical protein